MVRFFCPVGLTVNPRGKAYGMFSMKILFVVSLVLFEVGSAICGAAPNMDAIIVGRVIAGVGGAGVYVGGLTYISVLTTPNERPIYLAILMSVWGFGNVLGPIVGGSFATSSATWRWGFYINVGDCSCMTETLGLTPFLVASYRCRVRTRVPLQPPQH
jgi:MFS family permease